MEEPHPFKYSPNLHWAAFLWLSGYFSVFVAVPLPSPATVLHAGVPITSSKTLNGKTGKPPQLNIKSSLGPLTKFLCCCCCSVASVTSDSVRPHRRQPTRLPHSWDSPGKNTSVCCHFLLQCMKVKSESEVAQSCLTLATPCLASK